MRRIDLHPQALDELIAAALFYESQAKDLGFDFIACVQHASQRLLDFPGLGRPFGQKLRRLLVRRFPYGLLYHIEPERIFIVSVMHLHRRPGYWRSRI